MWNDRMAKPIGQEEAYAKGANVPTVRKFYACPCGRGRVVTESVPGFGDRFARLECAECEKKFSLREGCGYAWELVER